MTTAQRRMICLEILRSDYGGNLDTRLRDVFFRETGGRLNHRQAHVAFIAYRPETDCLQVYLVHSEFPVVPEGCCCMVFSSERAHIRFPYLFADTNPLLYRKF